VTAEEWRAIPGFQGRYEVSSHGRVRSIDRIVVRSNGYHYTVRGRLRRICVDKRDGLQSVALATGQRGRYHTVYVHRILAEVFGHEEAA
jgi:hypothetical protein